MKNFFTGKSSGTAYAVIGVVVLVMGLMLWHGL